MRWLAVALGAVLLASLAAGCIENERTDWGNEPWEPIPCDPGDPQTVGANARLVDGFEGTPREQADRVARLAGDAVENASRRDHNGTSVWDTDHGVVEVSTTRAGMAYRRDDAWLGQAEEPAREGLAEFLEGFGVDTATVSVQANGSDDAGDGTLRLTASQQVGSTPLRGNATLTVTTADDGESRTRLQVPALYAIDRGTIPGPPDEFLVQADHAYGLALDAADCWESRHLNEVWVVEERQPTRLERQLVVHNESLAYRVQVTLVQDGAADSPTKQVAVTVDALTGAVHAIEPSDPSAREQ